MAEPSTSFSFSYGWTQKPPGGQAALWMLDDCQMYALSDREILMRSVRTGATLLADLNDVNVLYLCREFRTLEGHVAAIVDKNPPLANEPGTVLRLLEHVISHGLMVRADTLGESLRGAAAPIARPVATIAIRSADRPAILRRLLDSLADNEARFGQRYHYLVVDDSRHGHHRQENEALVEDLRGRGLLRARYHGPAQQQRLIQRLVKAFPDAQRSIRFLLDGQAHEGQVTPGRGGNHILLVTAGQRLVLLDDDALCQARSLFRGIARPELSARSRAPWFFPSPAATGEQTAALDLDPLAEHGRLLGTRLDEALQAVAPGDLPPAALAHLGAGTLSNLGADSPIVVTTNDVIGDPGSGTNGWLYTSLEGEARARFWTTNEADYERHRTLRAMYVGHPGLSHFSTSSTLMTTTATGLDNRLLLPPMCPRYTNEDALLGAMVKYLYPRALFFNFGWAMPHRPEPVRTWAPDSFVAPGTVGLLRYLGNLAEAERRAWRDGAPAHQLALLGEAYLTLCGASQRSLREALVDQNLRLRAATVYKLRAALDEAPDAPSYWVRDVGRLIEANRKALVDPSSPLVSDLAAGEDEPALAALRALLADYGEALTTWPSLWEYCRGESHGAGRP